MHTHASSELVEPLPEPERTLNRRLRRRNRRVPFDQGNNPPQQPRVVHPPILDINYFHYFLVTLENLYPMDDEPMWAADHVVAPTPSFIITIPETANKFAIKGVYARACLDGMMRGCQRIWTVMDVPPSPDRVFDFPVAEPKPHPAYDFFAPGSILRYDKAPDNMNRWIEEDGPLRADLVEPVVDLVIDDMMAPMENPDKDVDMLMEEDDEDGDDEGEDDKDGWEVGGPSIAAPRPPFPVGRPILEVLNDGIAIGEIQPWVTTLEGRVEVLASQQEQAMTKVGEVEGRVLEMQDKVNNYPCDQVDGLKEDVDGLLGLKGQVQTLESTVQELRKENPKLKGLLSAKDSDYIMLASYMLGLGDRLAAVELQLPGPP
ncbi:hypothetical protein Tco_0677198 [Tanacetum coccineum]